MTSKTPAMILQELSTKECGQGPNYQLITQEQGTHDNIFEYIVDVLGVTATGRGRSKKKAKQETAQNALLQLKDTFHIDCMPSDLTQTSQISPDAEECNLRKVVNYIGELDGICRINELPRPVYDLIQESGPPHQKIFTYECKLGHYIVERSTASTKKQARHNASKQILERIEEIVPALAKEYNAELLELCDKDMEDIDRYKELTFMKVPNYKCKIRDYHLHLQDLLKQKHLINDDIEEYLNEPHSEENLKQFLDRLELKMNIEYLTEEDSKKQIVGCSLSTAVPLCGLGIAETKERAKQLALDVVFWQISVLLKSIINPLHPVQQGGPPQPEGGPPQPTPQPTQNGNNQQRGGRGRGAHYRRRQALFEYLAANRNARDQQGGPPQPEGGPPQPTQNGQME